MIPVYNIITFIKFLLVLYSFSVCYVLLFSHVFLFFFVYFCFFLIILSEFIVFIIFFYNFCFISYISSYTMIPVYNLITYIKFLIVLYSFSVCYVLLFPHTFLFLFKQFIFCYYSYFDAGNSIPLLNRPTVITGSFKGNSKFSITGNSAP